MLRAGKAETAATARVFWLGLEDLVVVVVVVVVVICFTIIVVLLFFAAVATDSQSNEG